jgi:hypothetical protein
VPHGDEPIEALEEERMLYVARDRIAHLFNELLVKVGEEKLIPVDDKEKTREEIYKLVNEHFAL